MNYPGLRKLHEKYSSHGLAIIAFPCNQFCEQAPASSECEREYALSQKFKFNFTIYDKIDVNGPNSHPIYQYIKNAPEASALDRKFEISWNYEKVLIDGDGKVAGRYAPDADPMIMEPDIAKLLGLNDPPRAMMFKILKDQSAGTSSSI